MKWLCWWNWTNCPAGSRIHSGIQLSWCDVLPGTERCSAPYPQLGSHEIQGTPSRYPDHQTHTYAGSWSRWWWRSGGWQDWTPWRWIWGEATSESAGLHLLHKEHDRVWSMLILTWLCQSSILQWPAGSSVYCYCKQTTKKYLIHLHLTMCC